MVSLPSTTELIQRHHLRPNKTLGQHFLTDPHLLEDIVRYAGITTDTQVIEVGAGPAGLTRALCESDAQSVHVVELDGRCITLLQEVQQHYPKLHITQGDAFDHPLHSLCSSPRSVVANLPYNVGTALIMGWLKALYQHDINYIDSITVMLQKEVVDRMTAQTGSKHYGRLSIICQWLCDTYHCLDVPPEAFTPPPKVMSSVVQLTPKAQPAFHASFTELERFLQAAFGQRRKMLRSSLKSWHPDPIALLESCMINPTRRAETLSLEEIGRLLSRKA